MKIITINLPESYLSAIKILNELGLYDSRSHAIRKALEIFLPKELTYKNSLEIEEFKMLITSRGVMS